MQGESYVKTTNFLRNLVFQAYCAENFNLGPSEKYFSCKY